MQVEGERVALWWYCFLSSCPHFHICGGTRQLTETGDRILFFKSQDVGIALWWWQWGSLLKEIVLKEVLHVIRVYTVCAGRIVVHVTHSGKEIYLLLLYEVCSWKCFVLGTPSLGLYKTILSKHQLTVETGEVRWWGKSGRSMLGEKGEAPWNWKFVTKDQSGKFPGILSWL